LEEKRSAGSNAMVADWQRVMGLWQKASPKVNERTSRLNRLQTNVLRLTKRMDAIAEYYAKSYDKMAESIEHGRNKMWGVTDRLCDALVWRGVDDRENVEDELSAEILNGCETISKKIRSGKSVTGRVNTMWTLDLIKRKKDRWDAELMRSSELFEAYLSWLGKCLDLNLTKTMNIQKLNEIERVEMEEYLRRIEGEDKEDKEGKRVSPVYNTNKATALKVAMYQNARELQKAYGQVNEMKKLISHGRTKLISHSRY
jgi:hypothetical protein